ncbi:MAG: hypothetical protein ACTSXY_12440 [Promethearchaeota archaeon]
MKIENHNRLSLLGYFLGVTFSFLSAWRYFVMFPDMDRAVVYVIIGLLICAWSYEHSARWNLANTISYIEDQLQERWGLNKC